MRNGIRLKYVHQWVDKRGGGARARYYFRRPGFKRIPLPGLPGSAEFMNAYQAAVAMQLPRPPIGASRTKAGSLGALIVSYLSSGEFLARPKSTQVTYRNILERFRREHGDKPVALLTRAHINAMLAQKVNTPAAANHWLRLVKVLMQLAVEEGYRPDNPANNIKRIRNRTDGFHTWDENEIAQFESRHAIGSKARLAFALLLYTAQRRSDVVRMGRQHIRDGVVHVRQQKTGAMLAIPLHPALAAIIEATPNKRVDHGSTTSFDGREKLNPLTLLTTAYGKPFTAAGFGNWFRDRCNEAGLPEHCAAPRPAQGRLPAPSRSRLQCKRNRIHQRPYDADQQRMARESMAVIARTKTGNA